MQPTLTVHEQRASFWKGLTISCLIAAVLFFIGYLIITDPFWAGIFQLLAFISFTGSILSFLKIRERKITLQLQFTPEHLVVNYLVKLKNEKEELFERATIKQITKKQEIPFRGMIPKIEGYTYRITFTDTGSELVLFTFGGRNIQVSPKTAAQIDTFLEEHI